VNEDPTLASTFHLKKIDICLEKFLKVELYLTKALAREKDSPHRPQPVDSICPICKNTIWNRCTKIRIVDGAATFFPSLKLPAVGGLILSSANRYR
jgi:hypothetical protein